MEAQGGQWVPVSLVGDSEELEMMRRILSQLTGLYLMYSDSRQPVWLCRRVDAPAVAHGVIYGHRNGEVDTPVVKGQYWVKMQRLQNWSTKVVMEVWERRDGYWSTRGNDLIDGEIGNILAIYGPIPEPWDAPAPQAKETNDE